VGSFNRADSFDYLLVIERRVAARLVPSEHQFHHYIWIDLMPQKMAREGSDCSVTSPFRHAFLHETAPVGEWMADRSIPGEPRLKKPNRKRREYALIWAMSTSPAIGLARGMNRWRDNNHTTIASEVKAGRHACSIADIETGMGKIKMASATPGYRFDGYRETPKAVFQCLEASLAAVQGINVKHYDARYRSGHHR
jgi:hypothetical protein